MASCNICLEGFKQPVSLPCGHIFCTECVIKTVQAVRPIRTVHACPMCRAPYNIAPLNPLVLPPHLRPFITPTIRRVYLDSPEEPKETSSSIPPHIAEELARLRNETTTLRSRCTLWKRRAELHGAATLGLLDFARMVRDQASALARERDEWARQCHTLKRKLDETSQPIQSKPSSYPEFPSSSFTFSFPPPSHVQTTPPPPTLSTSSFPSTSVEASRLAMSGLFDFHPCLNQASPSHLPQSLNLGPWPRQHFNTSGPSSVPSASSSASSLPVGHPPSSAGSLSGISPPQTNLEQPPAKRLRRDSVEMDRGTYRGGHLNQPHTMLGSPSSPRVPS